MGKVWFLISYGVMWSPGEVVPFIAQGTLGGKQRLWQNSSGSKQLTPSMWHAMSWSARPVSLGPRVMSPMVKAVETNTNPMAGKTGESSHSSPRSQIVTAQWCLAAQPHKYGQHLLPEVLLVGGLLFLDASLVALDSVGALPSSTLKLVLEYSLAIQSRPHPSRLETCFPTCCP